MNFRDGDSVMHWTYGLGKIIRLEERTLSGQKTMYYAVQIGDLTVWVPADDLLEQRLRRPTPQGEFKKLLSILSSRGEPLPDDRHERKIFLMELLRDGRAESLCRAIRSLSAYRHVRALNDNDLAILKRAQTALLGEWGFILSVTPLQAETELHRMLASAPPEIEDTMMSEEKKIILEAVERFARTGKTEDGQVKVTRVPDNKTSWVEQTAADGRSIMLKEYHVDDKIIWAGYSSRTGMVYLSSVV